MSLLTEDLTDQRASERARCVRLIRESLSVLSSKWAVGVLLALGDGARRYHEILGELEPISEKVLTQTLRTMERDGLITRHVHAEVPPRVEYSLTRWARRSAADEVARQLGDRERHPGGVGARALRRPHDEPEPAGGRSTGPEADACALVARARPDARARGGP